MARLLLCNSCKTVDRLGDYASHNDPDAKYDYDLRDSIDKHLRQSKYGSDPSRHPATLMHIADKELDLIDPGDLEKAFHDDELESYIREQRDHYKEGAMNCFNLHSRPAAGCIDWCNDNRAIGQVKGKAKEDRQYLCYFCPVATHVATEMRYKAGLYDQ